MSDERKVMDPLAQAGRRSAGLQSMTRPGCAASGIYHKDTQTQGGWDTEPLTSADGHGRWIDILGRWTRIVFRRGRRWSSREPRPGQARPKRVAGNCRGAGWKQVESAEETL